MPGPAGVRGRPRKPRSSVTFCQERSCCSSDQPEAAAFFCELCKTNQCSACCTELHSSSSFRNHEPRPLPPADPQLLCAGAQRACSGRNFADIFCTACQARLCVACDRKRHSGLAFSHDRLPLERHLEAERSRRERLKKAAEDGGGDWGSFEQEEVFHTLCAEEDDPLGLCNGAEEQFFSLEQQDMSAFGSLGGASSSRGLVPKSERPGGAMMSTIRVEEGRADSQPALQPALELMDAEEVLKFESAEQFLTGLNLDPSEKVTVVSIFGSTGVGKSHTLNAVFFKGQEVFKTSDTQSSCTCGVWIAYDCRLQCLVIDTEGLLGSTLSESRRHRLLLKVLGLSDVIIFRTRAARLENDMFLFLNDASVAFEEHFSAELRSLAQEMDVPVANLSPSVIIFHETHHTEPLLDKNKAKEFLYMRAKQMKLSLGAFPDLKYIGIRTRGSEATDFSKLCHELRQLLKNSESNRLARSPRVVFEVLRKLNCKYSGSITDEKVVAFSSKYFSCQTRCSACTSRCQLSLNHAERHCSTGGCKFRADLGNRVFLCRKCHENGQDQIVRWQTVSEQESGFLGVVKFLQRGHIIECPTHGIIYKSFQHWYNNPPPEAEATTIRVVHVWPGEIPLSTDGAPVHVGQRIMDIGGAMSEAVVPSVQVVSEWLSDQMAPEYWTPNAEAQHCKVCRATLGEKLTKHHCRRCGLCVCAHCSPRTLVLPGWGSAPVRVCNKCFERPLSSASSSDAAVEETSEDQRKATTGRVVTETVGQAASMFSYVMEPTKRWVKDLARPSYWKPDAQLIECADCKVAFGPVHAKEQQQKFGEEVTRHHCRRCGDGFCALCSTARLPVPSRGWENPVRVCNACAKFPPPL